LAKTGCKETWKQCSSFDVRALLQRTFAAAIEAAQSVHCIMPHAVGTSSRDRRSPTSMISEAVWFHPHVCLRLGKSMHQITSFRHPFGQINRSNASRLSIVFIRQIQQ
jgi:hypothetical protein